MFIYRRDGRCRAYPLPDLNRPMPVRPNSLSPPQTDLILGRSVLDSTSGSWTYGPCTRLDRLCLASTIKQSLDITRAWSALDQGLNNLSTTPRFGRVLDQQGVAARGCGWHIYVAQGFQGRVYKALEGVQAGWVSTRPIRRLTGMVAMKKFYFSYPQWCGQVEVIHRVWTSFVVLEYCRSGLNGRSGPG